MRRPTGGRPTIGAAGIRLRLAIHRVRSAGSSGTPTPSDERLHRRRDEHCSSAYRFPAQVDCGQPMVVPTTGANPNPRVYTVYRQVSDKGAPRASPPTSGTVRIRLRMAIKQDDSARADDIRPYVTSPRRVCEAKEIQFVFAVGLPRQKLPRARATRAPRFDQTGQSPVR